MIKKITEDVVAGLMKMGHTDRQLINDLSDVLCVTLTPYDIRQKETAIVVRDNTDIDTVARFFVAKTTAGLSPKTLKYYKLVLQKAFAMIGRNIKEMTADDVRLYLTQRRLAGVTNTSLNNERRVLSSFFTWAHDEEILPRNIMKRVTKIREQKKVKKPFTEEEMERLRAFAKNDRDRAIIEFLYSTGCRVSEMCQLNRDDIDYEHRECIVLGKGNKQRKVFLSYRCISLLQQYERQRLDTCEALFVTWPCNKFFKRETARLNKSGVEIMIRNTGKRAGIEKAHPHRIRRTAATFALRRGMPIEQVSKMLGHESLNTTTIYASSTTDEVKSSHDKYLI